MRDFWAIKDLLEWTTRYFTLNDIEQPRLEAEILLARVLNQNRVYLYTHYDQPVNANERTLYRQFIRRRIKGEPAAYILGSKEFMSLDFAVDDRVLIPRPETELMVEKVLHLAKKRTNPNMCICDVGTGSGAIAVSLAYYLPLAKVWALDISAPALELAAQNAARHKVRVEFMTSDLLQDLPQELRFDFVVANLPYIGTAEYEDLPWGVKGYEPKTALWAGVSGLEIYNRLIGQIPRHLKTDGYLLLEINPAQSRGVLDLLQSWEQAEVYKDGAGLDRLVVAVLGKEM